jgi:hypothetical protein
MTRLYPDRTWERCDRDGLRVQSLRGGCLGSTEYGDELSTHTPGPDLYDAVFSGLCQQRTSISGWCRRHGVDRDEARAALLGKATGQRAAVMVADLMAAAGLEVRHV